MNTFPSPRRRTVLAAIASTTAGAWVLPARAAAPWKPEKPVEIIIPSGTGGSIDRFGRVIQQIMQTHKLVDVPIVVVNKNGAAGAIAWNYLDQKKGDPHFLIVNTPNRITSSLMQANDRKDNSTPIAILSTEYHSLIVRADSPFKKAEEVIAKLRTDPGALRIGVAPGLGVGSHVALSIALKEANVDQKRAKMVVFNSSGQSVTAILGGHIDIASVGTSNALPMLQAGKVRILAMAAPTRVPAIAAPTWKELGVDAVYPSWRGIAAAPELTREQVQFWDGLFAKLIETPEWKEDLKRTYHEALYFDSAGTKGFLDNQFRTLHGALTEAGLVKSRT